MHSSRPSYFVPAGFIAGVLIGLAMIVAFTLPLFRVGMGALVLINLFQIPRLAWGFEQSGAGVRFWYPLWPPGNTAFALDDIETLAIASPFPGLAFYDRLDLRLKNGQRLRLQAYGTRSFRIVREALDSSPA